jgi:FkbM family methyltransferase
MFTRGNIIRKKFRSLLIRIFNWIENNNNANFFSNGEERFVETITNYFAKSQRTQLEFFDIGANRGNYTQVLLDRLSNKKLDARINVFEPTKSCFQMLGKRFEAFSNIMLNQTAASNADGYLPIYYDHEGSALASMHHRNLSAMGMSLNETELVQATRLDTYIKAKQITHIHLLKIDIEGHELAAFEGMGEYLRGDFVDFIQFEYGGANLDSKTSLMDIYTLLESRGFVLGKLMPKGIELRTYQAWMETFQYANYAAISSKLIEKLKS